MNIPEWFKNLFLPKHPAASQQEMDNAYSDYMRAKYGIPQTFADEEEGDN